MEQIKSVVEAAADVAQEIAGADLEVRTLSELEVALAGGGDGVVCW